MKFSKYTLFVCLSIIVGFLGVGFLIPISFGVLVPNWFLMAGYLFAIIGFGFCLVINAWAYGALDGSNR